MKNNYQMKFRDTTTGWDTTSNNVNAVNWFGMFPAEVALQAGNVDEFAAITDHPDFKIESLGRVDDFLAICSHESEKSFQEIQAYFKKKFEFDKTTRQFVKLH